MSKLVFRAMEVEDLPIVKRIEKECFTMPWSTQSFIHELTENHMAHYIVAVIDSNVVGYCGSWTIFDEAQITTIAVHPSYQGKGLGEALLRQMMNIVIQKGAKSLYLEVRVSNHTAQKLYSKLHFTKMGLRKKYYADNQEDAFVMGVDLVEVKEGFPCTRD